MERKLLATRNSKDQQSMVIRPRLACCCVLRCPCAARACAVPPSLLPVRARDHFPPHSRSQRPGSGKPIAPSRPRQPWDEHHNDHHKLMITEGQIITQALLTSAFCDAFC